MEYVAKPYSLFSWDRELSSKSLVLSENNRKVYLQSSLGSFKSALSDISGRIHYWEIRCVSGTNYKIGVSKLQESFENAFSDNANGWAFYNKGALRHNSNSDGPKYGEAFGAGDIIGVTVDACQGTCSFSKNGKDFGVAYTEAEKFTDGELYAAVTILKAGECVELLMPVPED